jgi:ABC-type Fe3+-hydroxamate transport system substrate-binding protein
MKLRIARLENTQRSFERKPTIYVEIDQPTWTVGEKSFVTQALALLGAQNIFADVPVYSLQAATEAIIKKDPEIILTFTERAEAMARRPGWQNLRAVKEGKIIDDFPEELLSHGNHRLVEGMEKLQARIAPWVKRST